MNKKLLVILGVTILLIGGLIFFLLIRQQPFSQEINSASDLGNAIEFAILNKLG